MQCEWLWLVGRGQSAVSPERVAWTPAHVLFRDNLVFNRANCPIRTRALMRFAHKIETRKLGQSPNELRGNELRRPGSTGMFQAQTERHGYLEFTSSPRLTANKPKLT